MSLRSTSSREVPFGTSTACSRPLTVNRNEATSSEEPAGGVVSDVARSSPVVGVGLAGCQLVGGFEAGSHRSRGAGHVLVVVNAEQADPALLAERQRDTAAQLHQFPLR